ncbi:hypothetical protein HanIR_Chr14g0685391 [Helianthus annuus]|nr:hypothetical protein HanIR_Chr14g0685391 [Helianthus annuus]
MGFAQKLTIHSILLSLNSNGDPKHIWNLYSVHRDHCKCPFVLSLNCLAFIAKKSSVFNKCFDF